MNGDTGSHRFYVGDENTASNLIMNIEQTSMNFYKDAYFSTKIFCNNFESFGDNNVVFYQNGEAFMTFDKTTDTIVFNKPTNIAGGGTYTDSQIDGFLALKADVSNIYTKAEVDNKGNNKVKYQDYFNQTDQTIYGQILIRNDNSFQMTLLDDSGNKNQMKFRTGNKIDVYNLPSNGTEKGLYLNYDTEHFVRVGNNAGHLGVNCVRDTNETDSFKVVGTSLFDGQARFKSGILFEGGEGQTLLTETTETTFNVVRFWNKETTLNPVLRLGVGGTDNVIDLTNGEIHCNQPLIVRYTGTNRYVKIQNGTDIDAYDSGNNAVDMRIQYNSSGAVLLGNPTNTPCIAVNKSAVVDKSFAVKGTSEFEGDIEILPPYKLKTDEINAYVFNNITAGVSTHFRYTGSDYMKYNHINSTVDFENTVVVSNSASVNVNDINSDGDADVFFKEMVLNTSDWMGQAR